jgi:hypothetical protein
MVVVFTSTTQQMYRQKKKLGDNIKYYKWRLFHTLARVK